MKSERGGVEMSTAVVDQFIDLLATAVADKLVEKQPKQEVSDKPTYMNKGQLASYLGTSRSTLDRWIKNDGFPASKIGGKYVYKTTDVDQWVETHAK